METLVVQQTDTKPSEGLPGVKYLLENRFVFKWTEAEVSMKRGEQELVMLCSEDTEETDQTTESPFSYALYTFPKIWLMDGKDEPPGWEKMVTIEGVKKMDSIITSLRSKKYKVEAILQWKRLGYTCTVRILPPFQQDIQVSGTEPKWLEIPAFGTNVGEAIDKCAVMCQGLIPTESHKEAGNL